MSGNHDHSSADPSPFADPDTPSLSRQLTRSGNELTGRGLVPATPRTIEDSREEPLVPPGHDQMSSAVPPTNHDSTRNSYVISTPGTPSGRPILLGVPSSDSPSRMLLGPTEKEVQETSRQSLSAGKKSCLVHELTEVYSLSIVTEPFRRVTMTRFDVRQRNREVN